MMVSASGPIFVFPSSSFRRTTKKNRKKEGKKKEKIQFAPEVVLTVCQRPHARGQVMAASGIFRWWRYSLRQNRATTPCDVLYTVVALCRPSLRRVKVLHSSSIMVLKQMLACGEDTKTTLRPYPSLACAVYYCWAFGRI